MAIYAQAFGAVMNRSSKDSESLWQRAVHRDEHRPHHIVFACERWKIIRFPCCKGGHAGVCHIRRDFHGDRRRGRTVGFPELLQMPEIFGNRSAKGNRLKKTQANSPGLAPLYFGLIRGAASHFDQEELIWHDVIGCELNTRAIIRYVPDRAINRAGAIAIDHFGGQQCLSALR